MPAKAYLALTRRANTRTELTEPQLNQLCVSNKDGDAHQERGDTWKRKIPLTRHLIVSERRYKAAKEDAYQRGYEAGRGIAADALRQSV